MFFFIWKCFIHLFFFNLKIICYNWEIPRCVNWIFKFIFLLALQNVSLLEKRIIWKCFLFENNICSFVGDFSHDFFVPLFLFFCARSQDCSGERVLDGTAEKIARLLSDADSASSAMPGGRAALKAVTLMFRKPAGAMKKPAAKREAGREKAAGMGMTHAEASGFGKIRMFANATRSYIQMHDEESGSWKPCLFGTSGHQHRLKTEYVFSKLQLETHTFPQVAKYKVLFSSGRLSVVSGEVVNVDGLATDADELDSSDWASTSDVD